MVTFKELKQNQGKFVCVHYSGRIYSMCEIEYDVEKDCIYLMNNDYSNNNGHKNEKYKFSILIEDQEWLDTIPNKITFINDSEENENQDQDYSYLIPILKKLNNYDKNM